jgi:predicted Rossmann-fold nucleotide-binding protein
MHFLLRAKALVAFPGGYGTLDEVFESLNLVQTRKIQPIPVVLVGAAHWRRVLDFDYLIEQGFITQQERELARVVETGAQAAQVILDFHGTSPAST